MDRTPLSQQLAFLERGALDAEATELLAQVVMAVKSTGKAGKLTVTLDLKYDQRMNCMEISASAKAKVPQPDRRRTFMFPNNTGELLRDDPEQQKLFGPPAVVADSTIESRERA